MNANSPNRSPGRFGGRMFPAAALAAATIALATLTRAALLASVPPGAIGAGEALASLVIGFAFDLVVATFMCAPLLALLMLAPDRLAATRPWRAFVLLAWLAAVYGLTLVAVAEWLFWQEFGGRFNFIAVDYLLYTHEVWNNIRESYPLQPLLLALMLPALAALVVLRGPLWSGAGAPVATRMRWVAVATGLALVAALARFADSDYREYSPRDIANELAGNGVFQFFAANRRNELPFERHYAAIDGRRALGIVRAALAASASRPSPLIGEGVERLVAPRLAPARPPSIVMISIESMGAEFLGSYGNRRNLTPNLDRIARESLWFSNVYATGNRTVRGLEALTLALPPTPGQSIVRRPGNEGLFTLGSVLEDKGYAVTYAYGGYGYFDNMNAFFGANDYNIVDRTDIPGERIHFANAWGVADEILFDYVLDTLDRGTAGDQGRKPFFVHIMTVSNHRPYTYPARRIDIASGSGRDGAVKYSDYALGRFLERARTRPWFGETIFVITADHGANARGTMEIPIDKYRVPLFFYAPGRIEPRRIDRLMSQIDIAPTLLGMTGLSYYTKFFGHDMLDAPAASDRAFVANYQTLGYLRDGRLVTLQPKRRSRAYRVDADGKILAPIEDRALTEEAVAFYQCASYLFRSGLYRDEEQVPPERRDATRGAPAHRKPG
ncbi:MAG: LTA synthase family protein [Burkholderiales bacterium]|nr:LTA synthase family protein [Burkholderiales bacterium]